MTVTVDYRHARPGDAERIAALYDEVYQGGYPIRECVETESVKRILESREHLWMIAASNGSIVGATVARPEKWNRSYETCRSVTKKECAGAGIGFILYDNTLHEAMQRDDCDMLFGYPRTDGMRRLMEKSDPPIIVVGTDYGMHLVSGQREEHLWSLIANPLREIDLVLEPRVRSQRLLDELGLKGKPGPYPLEIVVGPPGSLEHECSSGIIHYNEFAPSRCAQVTRVDADSCRDVCRAVAAFNESAVYDHVSMYVLADKECVSASLRQQGFALSAYLPAWFSVDGKRYSCNNLASRKGPAKLLGTDDIVHKLRSELS